MRRRLTVLVAMAVMLVMVSSPALADPGGVPHENSCGVGKDFSAELREDFNPEQYPPRPGASEIRDLPPTECSGK